jgi:dephospho-CoA kinase
MPASGKTVAVQIARERSIPVIRMGDAVWEETQKQGLPFNDANVGYVANSMREKYGMDIWAKRTLEKIKSKRKDICLVIDGIRNCEEIDLFKKKLGDKFTVIAILASDDIRKKRVLQRKRKDDGDIRDFKERDKRERSWGLGEVINKADIKIVNEGGIDRFRKKIDKILNTMEKTII